MWVPVIHCMDLYVTCQMPPTGRTAHSKEGGNYPERANTALTLLLKHTDQILKFDFKNVSALNVTCSLHPQVFAVPFLCARLWAKLLESFQTVPSLCLGSS